MKDNLLKHGNNNMILLDATFGTNHMKMPLCTALVIDEFGNGSPAFMGYRPSWFTSLHARVCYARASTRCYARASTRRILASGWQLCCSTCGKVTLIGCAHASWLMTLLPRSMPSGRQPYLWFHQCFSFLLWRLFPLHHSKLDMVVCQVGLDFSRVQLAFLGVPSLKGF